MLKMVENLKRNRMTYNYTRGIVKDAAKNYSYNYMDNYKCLIYGDQVFYVIHSNEMLHIRGMFIAAAMCGSIFVDDYFFQMSKEAQCACLNHEEGHLRDERINDFKLLVKYTMGITSVVESMEFAADDNAIRVCGKEATRKMLIELIATFTKNNLYLPKKTIKLTAKRIHRIDNMK